MSDNNGYIYLIHFKEKFHHAQHYIGWTKDVDARLERHLAGHGSRLIRAIVRSGIPFEVVRIWENVDRHFERKLKNRKNAKFLCPICKVKHE